MSGLMKSILLSVWLALLAGGGGPSAYSAASVIAKPAGTAVKGSFQLNRSFEIKRGETRIGLDGKRKLQLNFAAVLEDSRCPQGARCVWAGQVRVKLRFRVGEGQPEELELRLPAPGDKPPRTTDGVYAFALEDLLPYPSVGQQATRSDHVLKLRILKP
ncbi:MAG: hypothetical protein CVV27_15490 [Candidatus Melainabacteria bacterium HGW-Melainabacteria-1]|nr:MAG: hypothetical protein CVV27_15490 [Candidatus Melainabacteria bacterium HGW-Melainabacteria-1]